MTVSPGHAVAPGPWCSMDSKGELLGSHWSLPAHEQTVPADVL